MRNEPNLPDDMNDAPHFALRPPRRPRFSKISAAPLLAAAVMLSPFSAMAVEIIAGGKPKAVIVVPDDAPPVVTYAAEELASHLKLATDATFPIKKESQLSKAPENAIYLGQTQALEAIGSSLPKLKKNAYLRRSTATALFLAGVDDPQWSSPIHERLGMGTLMAVYDFLDRDLGARWFWPGELGTEVPRRKELTLKEKPEQVTRPRFLFNRYGYNPMKRRIGDWNEGETFSSESFEAVHQWLRHQRFTVTLDIETNHAYGKYWKRFGKTHPEFFALRPDGKREPVDRRDYLVQMCVSNPGLWKAVVADWLEDDPRRPWIAGFENDRRAIDPPCSCAACRAWDLPEAKLSVPNNPWHIDARAPEEIDPYETVSLSDRYARFYLELQKEGQKHDPFAKVAGFAYSSYSDAPVKVRLNPNIIISIVPPYIYPFGEGKEGQFRELWDRWKATGATLYYRPNHTLVGYCLPYIYSKQLGKDLKHAMENGMTGSIFDSLLGMWGVQGPDLYLLGRLHARPEMTPEAVLDEYYHAFGPAQQAVRDYFAYWEEITRRCDEAFREKINSGWAVISAGGHLVYTPEVMEKGAALLHQAAEKAKDSPRHAARVEYLAIWLENARLSVELQRMSKRLEEGKESIEEKRSRLETRDTLMEFRRANQRFFVGGNWDKIGPYEPWHRWEE